MNTPVKVLNAIQPFDDSQRWEDVGSLGQTLAAWRSGQKAAAEGSVLGAGPLDNHMVALAGAAGLQSDVSQERATIWRYGKAGHRLAGLPVVAYGGPLEAAWGDGVWTDGLHVWVSTSSLTRLRRQGMHLSSGSKPALTPLTSALLQAAASSVPGLLETESNPDAASGESIFAGTAADDVRAPRRWSEVRTTLMALPGGAGFLNGWPETAWSDDEVAQVAAGWPEQFEDDGALGEWWNAALAAPLSAPMLPPGMQTGAGLNSAAWRREEERVWQLVERYFRTDDPHRFRAWMRWLDVVDASTDGSLPHSAWIARGRTWFWHTMHWDASSTIQALGSGMPGSTAETFVNARELLKENLVEWSQSPHFYEHMRHMALESVPGFASDYAWADHALGNWTAMLSEIRDGRLPHELSAGGFPWKKHLAGLRAASRTEWLGASVLSDPGAFDAAEAWTYALSEEAAVGLLDAGIPVAVRSANPKWGEPEGSTPLHRAVREWSPDTVRRILEAGADPHATDARRNTALAMARHPETVRLLLAAGLSVTDAAKPFKTQKNKFEGRTALHWAALGGYPEKEATLCALLEAGADPNAETPTGETPLVALLTSEDRGAWGGALSLLLDHTHSMHRSRPLSLRSLLSLLLQSGQNIDASNVGILTPDEFLNGLDQLLARDAPFSEGPGVGAIVRAAQFKNPAVADGALRRLIHHPQASFEKTGREALKNAATEEAKAVLQAWGSGARLDTSLPHQTPRATRKRF